MPEKLCPICQQRPADPKARAPRGEHWCMPCQDEFDAIDWEKHFEDRNK